MIMITVQMFAEKTLNPKKHTELLSSDKNLRKHAPRRSFSVSQFFVIASL